MSIGQGVVAYFNLLAVFAWRKREELQRTGIKPNASKSVVRGSRQIKFMKPYFQNPCKTPARWPEVVTKETRLNTRIIKA
jgi:hypothetical protein